MMVSNAVKLAFVMATQAEEPGLTATCTKAVRQTVIYPLLINVVLTEALQTFNTTVSVPSLDHLTLILSSLHMKWVI